MARFTNRAQLVYNNEVTSSNIAMEEIVEVLSAAKTAVRSHYGPGERITYIVSIVNTGSAAFSDMTVTDDLGAYTFQGKTLQPLTYVEGSMHYYNNGMRQSDPEVESGALLCMSGIGVPAGGNAVLIYQAQINPYAPLEATAHIESKTTISGSGASPASASAIVTAESQPLLTITKSVSPVPVVENSILTYTFLLQNNGNTAANADTAAIVTDQFDPALSALSVSFNGTPWHEHTHYTYDAHSGEFATIAGQITVPAATYAQDPSTGLWQVTPGLSTLTVSGTV